MLFSVFFSHFSNAMTEWTYHREHWEVVRIWDFIVWLVLNPGLKHFQGSQILTAP